VTTATETDRVMFVSSDGHATARMRDYRPYLESRWHKSFDEFCELHDKSGSRNFDPPALRLRVEEAYVQEWIGQTSPDRLDGNWDPAKRLRECEGEGIVAEVLFPDFGLPWELTSPMLASFLKLPPRTVEQADAANRAYARWLVDFCSYAPERFAGMIPLRLDETDEAVRQITWARQAGLKGIVLPIFDAARPLFHEHYEPVWRALEDLDMIANVHAGTSAVMPWGAVYNQSLPHRHMGLPIFQGSTLAREILGQMIWGGVLERHPRLRLVLTELQSGWVIETLRRMDYSYEGSYLSHEVHQIMRLKPSEYYERQVWLGSSLFSQSEMEAREQIGVGKMMLGADYPHHEGAWAGGNLNYLQATLGAAGVTEADARTMLGETACTVFGFNRGELAKVTGRAGHRMAAVLTPPTEDLFPRGDVHRPL
jgi:predicted TIM-barrel fold metal-dependent hydrolase